MRPIHKAFRYFRREVYIVLGLLVVASLVAREIRLITERHERRRLETRVCLAELQAIKAANPLARRLVHPSDPCMAVQVVRGGQ